MIRGSYSASSAAAVAASERGEWLRPALVFLLQLANLAHDRGDLGL
jgi:hypothetical protein